MGADVAAADGGRAGWRQVRSGGAGAWAGAGGSFGVNGRECSVTVGVQPPAPRHGLGLASPASPVSQAPSGCPGPGGPVSPVRDWRFGSVRAGRAGGVGHFGVQVGTGGQAVGFVPRCRAMSAWAALHAASPGQRGLLSRWRCWCLTMQAYTLILNKFIRKRENEQQIIRRTSVSEANRT